jgi:CheY-like chemotaxis protein
VKKPSYTILMADDDEDDCLLVREALAEAGQDHDLQIVRDGEALLDYLARSAGGDGAPPRPALILLDLKMPGKDGRQALRELKADPRLRRDIPIVVLTTSAARDDVGFCYAMGVNSYVTKPASFRGMVEVMEVLGRYWFETVELPPEE